MQEVKRHVTWLLLVDGAVNMSDRVVESALFSERSSFQVLTSFCLCLRVLALREEVTEWRQVPGEWLRRTDDAGIVDRVKRCVYDGRVTQAPSRLPPGKHIRVHVYERSAHLHVAEGGRQLYPDVFAYCLFTGRQDVESCVLVRNTLGDTGSHCERCQGRSLHSAVRQSLEEERTVSASQVD